MRFGIILVLMMVVTVGGFAHASVNGHLQNEKIEAFALLDAEITRLRQVAQSTSDEFLYRSLYHLIPLFYATRENFAALVAGSVFIPSGALIENVRNILAISASIK